MQITITLPFLMRIEMLFALIKEAVSGCRQNQTQQLQQRGMEKGLFRQIFYREAEKRREGKGKGQPSLGLIK